MSSFLGIVFYIRNIILLGLSTRKNITHVSLGEFIFIREFLESGVIQKSEAIKLLDRSHMGAFQNVGSLFGGSHKTDYSFGLHVTGILGYMLGSPHSWKLPSMIQCCNNPPHPAIVQRRHTVLAFWYWTAPPPPPAACTNAFC